MDVLSILQTIANFELPSAEIRYTGLGFKSRLKQSLAKLDAMIKDKSRFPLN